MHINGENKTRKQQKFRAKWGGNGIRDIKDSKYKKRTINIKITNGGNLKEGG